MWIITQSALSQIRRKHIIDAVPDIVRDFPRLRLPDPYFISHRQYILHTRGHPTSVYGGRVFPIQRAAVSEVIRGRKPVAGILLII